MINDYALCGKFLLTQGNSHLQAFYQSVQLRVDEAAKRMVLPTKKILMKCICSIEKESFMVRENEELRVYMDKHQMDSLYMLTFLYCLYGQNDLKHTLFTQMTELFPYFEKRLAFALLVLQAEKCFLYGDLSQSRVYMNATDEHDYASEFQYLKQNKPAEFVFVSNLVEKTGLKQDILFAHALNLFVFHEYAHVKFSLDKHQLQLFIDAVERTKSLTEHSAQMIVDPVFSTVPSVSIEECVCDTYALYLLFDYVYEHLSHYDIEHMIDSYFASVLNLALVHCNSEDKELITDRDYIYAGMRAILSIKALSLIWSLENRSSVEISALESAMDYSFNKYRGMKSTLDDNWSKLFSKYHIKVRESLPHSDKVAVSKQLLSRFSCVA